MQEGGGNSTKSVLPPFSKGINSNRKEFVPLGRYLFRRGSVCSKVNRKSHKLSPLTFTTLLANSADDKLVIFYFSQKTGFDISCKLCIKYQKQFSGKNTKNISKCLLKILPRVLSIKTKSTKSIKSPLNWSYAE